MKKTHFLLALLMGVASVGASAQTAEYKQVWSADLGDGTYVNPVLNGDFPDIDVIRVEDTYYMVSTTMYHFPGATILKSKDLVNWEYCANPLEKIDDNDAYNLKNGYHHYSQGQWAASLNYYKGKFYLYFICYGRSGADNTQNILLTATDPEGTWTMTKMSEHYYDSGWLFDDGENGDGYLYVACGIGDIWVNKLNPKTLNKIEGTRVISVGNGCEGSHMYHIGDYYYIYATYGGTEGSQTIFRSENPMGPYEEHNGRVFAGQKIHQGALIETQTGEWWTMLFKDAGAIGRIPYLEPVKWVDGWPIIGNNGIDVSKDGEPYKKPDVGQTYEKTYLASTDAFTDVKLGLQWEWNHNPDNSAWSLTERPGYLRLYTANVTDELNTAHNSLTQRIMGLSPNGTASNQYKNSFGIVKMDLSHMQEGDVAGLAVFQNPYSFIGVKVIDGQKCLYAEQCTFNSQKLNKEKTKTGIALTSDVVYLRAVVNYGTNQCRYHYSYDNEKWMPWGYTMSMGYTLDYFVGQRFYLFNYATKQLGGFVDIDWFSTEQKYSEEMFGVPDPMDAYTEDDLTMDNLTIDTDGVVLMAGTSEPLNITCTARSGLQQNVAARCTYKVGNPAIASINGGRVFGKMYGATRVLATYTDPYGHSQHVSFLTTVHVFPMMSEFFNPSIRGTGTFSERIGSIKTAQNGLAGWTYPSGIDLSDYNYIVIKFMRASSCSPSFCIYDKDNTNAPAAVYEIGKQKQVAIPLHDLQTTDGTSIDLSHIFHAAFTSDGGSAMYVKEIYLSNDGETPADPLDPGPDPKPDQLVGDLDGDNVITVSDISLLIDVYLGTSTDYDLSVCDIDGDGNITVEDIANLIAQYLNGEEQ
ncbi:MAG: family 43 glycosylhydrolase [Bacteroidaceae bacterium]|nr:family 43 glycosylhydrolase [Bacteroidaceae bacterium]